ncbi:MAG: ribonuclease HII [Patescibacteria group bacterium]|nr:ribonuclease HII [Patescibacteria group bacterium]MCL5261973.1 ribonuclease HII [Patescibacteria group bacterium]
MKYILGVDEVGRGPLAGPVCVGACLLPAGFKPKAGPLKLKDSKRLSAGERKKWKKWLEYQAVHRPSSSRLRIVYATSRIYPRKIDKMNIANAANAAAYKSCRKICSELSKSRQTSEVRIYLDGGLYLKSRHWQETVAGRDFKKVLIRSVKTVVSGDERFVAIKLASIVAKVSRDCYMDLKHKDYPAYNFIRHKGYGTKEHIEAIRRHGPSPIHRLTFLENCNNIKPK